jgi:hypothetical protein
MIISIQLFLIILNHFYHHLMIIYNNHPAFGRQQQSQGQWLQWWPAIARLGMWRRRWKRWVEDVGWLFLPVRKCQFCIVTIVKTLYDPE